MESCVSLTLEKLFHWHCTGPEPKSDQMDGKWSGGKTVQWDCPLLCQEELALYARLGVCLVPENLKNRFAYTTSWARYIHSFSLFSHCC